MSKGMDVIRDRVREVDADMAEWQRAVVRVRSGWEIVEYRLAWGFVTLSAFATGWLLCELVNLIGS
jgi:hypothetical protein